MNGGGLLHGDLQSLFFAQVLSFIDLRTAHESMETGAFMNVKV